MIFLIVFNQNLLLTQSCLVTGTIFFVKYFPLKILRYYLLCLQSCSQDKGVTDSCGNYYILWLWKSTLLSDLMYHISQSKYKKRRLLKLQVIVEFSKPLSYLFFISLPMFIAIVADIEANVIDCFACKWCDNRENWRQRSHHTEPSKGSEFS